MKPNQKQNFISSKIMSFHMVMYKWAPALMLLLLYLTSILICFTNFVIYKWTKKFPHKNIWYHHRNRSFLETVADIWYIVFIIDVLRKTLKIIFRVKKKASINHIFQEQGGELKFFKILYFTSCDEKYKLDGKWKFSQVLNS